MASRRLEVVIAGDAKGAQQAFGDTEKGADSLASRMTSSLGDAGRAVGLAAVAGAVGIGVALKGAYDAAVESQKIANETERVIRTTGGAANVSAEEVGNLASALSEMTGIDDEVVQGAENLLLTFTEVKNRVGEGNDVFNIATGLALDMATALGTDSKDAALQLGKALNDPIKGITALSRAGVSFTQQQKDQIKTLVASGDTLGAQKIILAELSKEFGGAAMAAATPLEKLQVKLGNFQEAIGARLIPIVDSAVGWLGDRLPDALDSADQVFANIIVGVQAFTEAWSAADGQVTLSGFPGFMEDLANKVKPPFEAIRSFVGDRVMPVLSEGFRLVRDDGAAAAAVISGVIVAAFVALGVAAGQAAVAVVSATWPFVLIIAVVGGLAFALIKLWQNWDTFREVVTGAVTWLQANAVPIFESVKNAVVAFYQVALVPLLGYIQANSEQLATVGKVLLVVAGIIVGVVIAGWLALAGAFVAAIAISAVLVTAVVAVVAVLYNLGQVLWDVFQNVRDALGGAWEAIENFVTAIPEKLGGVVEAIEGFFGSLPEKIGGFIDPIEATLAGFVSAIVGFFVQLPGRIWAGLAALPGILVNAFVAAFDAATFAIGFALGTIVNFFVQLPGRIMAVAVFLWSVITTVFTVVKDTAINLVTTAVNGVVDFFAQAPGRIAAGLSFLWGVISTAFTVAKDTAINVTLAAVNTVVSFFASLPGRAAGALSSLWGAISGAFFTAKDQSVGQASSLVNSVTGFLSSLPGRAAGALSGFAGAVTGALSAAVGAAASIGGDIVRGVANGITSSVGFVIDAARRAASNIIKGFTSALGIGSPSKVMADQVGRWLPAGIAMGMQQGMAPLLASVGDMVAAVVAKGRYGLADAAKELLSAMQRGVFIEEDLSFRGMSSQYSDFLEAGGLAGDGSSVNRNLLGGAYGSADSTWRGNWWDAGLLSNRLTGLSQAGPPPQQQTVHININIDQGYVGDEDGLGRVLVRHLSAAQRSGTRMPWATAG